MTGHQATRKEAAMLDPAGTGPAERGRRPKPLLRTMLGDVLRRTRLEQGRTLADVARVARVSMQYLSELERGRKEASSEILAAICDALEVDLPDVLAEVGRDLAGAGTEQQALVIRLGIGPDQHAAGVRPGDVVGLLAA
jgi:transcriptional regulator with XRE-family HTH domain